VDVPPGGIDEDVYATVKRQKSDENRQELRKGQVMSAFRIYNDEWERLIVGCSMAIYPHY
jgi:hypothetical protein